jgi:PIN domain nuclease of toxin-antitoxin system
MKRLLLDTHIFVWAKTAQRPLAPGIAAAIVDPANEVAVSVVSAWELSIKSAAGKLTGDVSLLIGSRERFEQLLSDSGFDLLQIRLDHVFATQRLPLRHRDPFDRMIVAQAMTERMTLVTVDRRLSAYAGLDMIVGA